jgi:hypothetical protein
MIGKRSAEMKTAQFYQTDIYRIIEAMKATGNQPGVVRQWRNLAETWATENGGPEAEAIRAWLPFWKVRPFYTATELCPIFPVLAVTFGFASKAAPQMSPNRLANLLDFGGLPKLINGAENKGFKSPFTGQFDNYYIVEHIHFWKNRLISQEIFEEVFIP